MEEEHVLDFEEDEEVIKKTLKKGARLIDGVHITPELVCNEKCDGCHHEKPKLIKMVALIGLKAKDKIVVDVWAYQYCLDCLSKLAETPVKVVDDQNSMYA